MDILSFPISLRNELTSMARLAPWSFFPLIRLRQRFNRAKWMLLDPSTELVIEGYFRCANCFAHDAFHDAQHRPVKTASHSHAAATVIKAVRRGVPTLVLIRRPADAVASRCIKHPHVSVAHAIRDYSRFYHAITPYADGYVVADFRQVISDFGAVIRQVNTSFRTNFDPFDHTKENAERVRKIVDKVDVIVDPSNRPLPVSARQEKRERGEYFLNEIARPEHASRLARAEDMYRKLSPLGQDDPAAPMKSHGTPAC